MTDSKKPETVMDNELDEAQGGGLMDTPVGGWGVRARPASSFEDKQGAEQFHTSTGGAPNV